MTIDTSKLRVSTKSLVSVVFGAGALLQIPAVDNALLQLAHTHPHVLTVIGTLTTIAALLHNPEVCKVFGIKPDQAQ